jgi:hypothetical protein
MVAECLQWLEKDFGLLQNPHSEMGSLMPVPGDFARLGGVV